MVVDVRFGSKADIAAGLSDVRFTPISAQSVRLGSLRFKNHANTPG
jgi:hypothetical protein